MKMLIRRLFTCFLFFNSIWMYTWPPALYNCRNTCFLNATLQVLYNISELTVTLAFSESPYPAASATNLYMELLKYIEKEKESVPNKSVIFDCKRYTLLLPRLNTEVRRLMKKGEKEKELLCAQEDATEFMTLFLNALRNQAQDNTLKDKITELFEFYLASNILCPSTPASKTLETHLDLSIQTIDAQRKTLKSLRQCFGDYFKREALLEYKDSQGRQRSDCIKQLKMLKSPKVLIVNLKRYSFVTGKEEKLYHKIYVPLELNVADFVEVKPSSLDNHFELIGVIVQGGSADAGHYWAYVNKHDKFEKQHQWFKCDDEHIAKANIKDAGVIWEIEGTGSTQAPTGYCLVYQKKAITEPEFKAWKAAEDEREQKAVGVTKPIVIDQSTKIDPASFGALDADLRRLTSSLGNLHTELGRLVR